MLMELVLSLSLTMASCFNVILHISQEKTYNWLCQNHSSCIWRWWIISIIADADNHYGVIYLSESDRPFAGWVQCDGIRTYWWIANTNVECRFAWLTYERAIAVLVCDLVVRSPSNLPSWISLDTLNNLWIILHILNGGQGRMQNPIRLFC